MRTRPFAIVFLGFWLATAAAQDAKIDFQQFASSDGKYKVQFPGPVKTQTIEVKTPSGAQNLTLDSVSFPGDTVFMVSYIDTPPEAAKNPSGPRLDKIRDASKGEDGKVLSEKDMSVGTEKYPGRDVVIEKAGVVIRTRIVLADKRLYQVMVQSTKEFVTSPTANKFFDSFDVTK